MNTMMDTEDSRLYLQAAANLFPELLGIDNRTDARACVAALDKALGFPIWESYQTRPSWADKPATPELRNLIELLCGPHGQTILKAYQAKQGMLNVE